MIGCSTPELPSPANCSCPTYTATIIHPTGYTAFDGYRAVRIFDYDTVVEYVTDVKTNGALIM